MSQENRNMGLVGNVAMKAPCRLCSTTNITTLNGLLTVDGVVTAAGDRVLLTAQTSGVDNGIYVADTGDWERSVDCDGVLDLVYGTLVKVNLGTANSGFWYCSTTTDPIVVGSTSIAFGMASSTLAVISAFMQTMLDDVDAATARGTLVAAKSGANTDLTSVYLNNTGLKIKDTDASHGLSVVPGSNLTADHTLTISTGDADRALTIAGTASISGTNTGDLIPQKHIAGLTYSNNGADATNDIDFAAGSCVDSTGAVLITCAAMTKRLDANWAAGTNQGMRNSAAAITDTDYYLWAVAEANGTQDYYAHTSATAATVLTALQAETGGSTYVYLRLVGWIKRVSATIVAFTTYETNGGGLDLLWTVPTLDINLANTLSTARRTDAVKVPLAFSVESHLNVGVVDGTGGLTWVCCPDQTDAAPSSTAAPLSNAFSPASATASFFGQIKVRTSSAGLIAARSTVTADSYVVSTMGFAWARRN